ncbi:MAG: family 10 glycosylhydrolase [Phycisphaerales bacterium]|nr:MAG: family 10 glycosylhydrolase [Phycisphaerales bacterium]
MVSASCRHRTLVVVVALGVLSCVGSVSAQSEFRGFWVDAFHPGFKTTSQINDMVNRAVTGNYNAIVAEVLAYQDNAGSGHGAYWKSSIVPWASEVAWNFDPLAYLCQQAHAQGIEVHAWLVAYRVSTSWPPSGNSTIASHPEWIMVPRGNMGTGPAPILGKYTLDPGSPEVQEYIISIVQELVGGYPIDGINWDYIRYTQTDAGYPADLTYTKSSLARFQDITGYVGTPPSEGEALWDDFRRRTINELVRRARAEVAAIASNPRQPVCHSADLLATGNAPYSFSSSLAYIYFQNWRHWMEMGWLDAGMPMNYKREHCTGGAQGDQATWYRNWIDAIVNDWRYDRHMYCGQADYLNSMANSVIQLQYVYAAGADGSMNYSYYATRAAETVCDDSDSWVNDWSWYSYVAANIFTSPASLPSMPWRDPAVAVEGTLWGQVTDHSTGLPVDDATVQVGTLAPVQTDGNGYYVVTLVPATQTGTAYDVQVTKAGYPDWMVSGVLVVAGDIRRRDVDLGAPPPPGDMDHDGDVDYDDLMYFVFCLQGPGVTYLPGHLCLDGDADEDTDVDLVDFASFQDVFTGPS